MRPTVDFEKLLAEQGMPTSTEGVIALLEADVTAANSIISNNSAMSPFWRLFSACVVTPVLWLIKTLLANHVLPAMFAATATKKYLELKAWDVGLTRKAAVKTQGNISFTKLDINAPVVVEAGTIIQTDSTLGAVYKVVVLNNTLIPTGTLSAPVLCEALEAGAGYNLPAGFFNVMQSVVPGIDSVTNDANWITRSGADLEQDEALALRIRDQFASVGNYHIDAVYRAAIASFAGIQSDLLFFEHNAPRGPGTANCFVMMPVGETPSSLIDSINDYITNQGYHGHGDDLLAIAIPAAPADIELEFWHRENLSVEEIDALEAGIEARVRAAFRESDLYPDITRTLPQSVFAFSQLIQELHSALPGLKSIRFTTEDIENALVLPRINSLTITNSGVAP
ncbi:baseplate J/gp47 family protein [Rheinheimera texasensis]|uniref:baseplate J/gp47 family protein n=1 Tax=Rheinheimera texasensis TaxID=306205 RepID=UPI0032B1B258